MTNPGLNSYLEPILIGLAGLAGLTASLFIVLAGLNYITSRGQPAKLVLAKETLVRSVSGLVLILAAGSLVGLLATVSQPVVEPAVLQPPLPPISGFESTAQAGWLDRALSLVAGLGLTVIDALGQPLLATLDQLATTTPSVSGNPTAVRVWLAVVAISNSLLVLLISLVGFRLMATTSFGWHHLSLKTWLPQLGLTFLAINLSLALIDGLISLANHLNQALIDALPQASVWAGLTGLVTNSQQLGWAGLILMGLFLALALALAVYYLIRLMIIYVGASLAPLVLLMTLIPALRGFGQLAIRSYLATIFVLLIHTLVLAVGAGWLANLAETDSGGWLQLLLAIALSWFLLRLPRLLANFNYVTLAPRSFQLLGQQLRAGLAELRHQLAGQRAQTSARDKLSTII